MHSFASHIENYLDLFRKGETDSAFHGLLEISREILPELMTIFRSERDARMRELLVEVIWEYREPSAIPFLGEALLDPDPGVWRQALNGLVTLASPAALDALRSARTRKFPRQRDAEEFYRWLEEAIIQVEPP